MIRRWDMLPGGVFAAATIVKQRSMRGLPTDPVRRRGQVRSTMELPGPRPIDRYAKPTHPLDRLWFTPHGPHTRFPGPPRLLGRMTGKRARSSSSTTRPAATSSLRAS